MNGNAGKHKDSPTENLSQAAAPGGGHPPRFLRLQQILVPIDFTQESGRALRDAVALGRETGSVVVALHVIDEKAERDVLLSAIAPVDGLPFFLDSYATVPVDVLRRERTLDLWNFVAQYAGRMQQERVRKVIRMGKLTREITTFMQDEAVDLLVPIRDDKAQQPPGPFRGRHPLQVLDQDQARGFQPPFVERIFSLPQGVG